MRGTPSRVNAHIRRHVPVRDAIGPFLSGVEINHQEIAIQILDWGVQYNTWVLWISTNEINRREEDIWHVRSFKVGKGHYYGGHYP